MRAAILIALASCVGEGPAPSAPSKVQVLFALELHPLQQDDDCKLGPYIGSVALGADAGYVVTHSFLPACGGGGGGGNQQQMPSLVFEFDKRTRNQTPIGDAGMVQEGGGGSLPRIAAIGNDAVWMSADNGGIATVRSKSGQIAGTFAPMSQMGIPNLASIVVDGNTSYIATATDAGTATRVMSPRYPCCGPSINNSGGYSLMQLTNSASITSAAKIGAPMFFYEQTTTSMIANTSSLVYIEHASPIARIAMMPKGGGAAETLASFGFPGGLAADDVHVAWSETQNFTINDASTCKIFSTTVAAPRTETLLLSTTKFSCIDLALDGDHVYFTMVQRIEAEFGDLVQNLGIGRVALASKQPETILLGIPGPHAGPRQVFVDGDGIIVVAPFAIARIAKAELDGKLEITP